jgi:hypothetical protein
LQSLLSIEAIKQISKLSVIATKQAMAEAIKKIYYTVFADGFFFVFGLAENPLNAKVNTIRNRTASQALASDWANVGADFRKVFDSSIANV